MASNPTFSVEYITSLITSTKLTPHLLVELLADLEPSAITTSLTEQTVNLISTYYSAFLLSLLLVDDVNEARFLSKRISSHLAPTLPSQLPTPVSDLTAYPLIPPAYNLLKAVYTRSYGSIYNILLSTPWSPELQPLASAFLEHFRRKTFKLVSYAYTTITPNQAATYLGFENESEEVVLEKLMAEGWMWDGDQGLLKTVATEDDDDDVGGVISQAKGGKDGRIERLTGLVTHLTEV
ncbi:COP9 signalosome [Tirmania nivea]|nr:COP9 signalosome [Tirmania nivea]